MDPFVTIHPSSYKRENLFPCITDEYRRCIQDNFIGSSFNDLDLDLDSLFVGREPFDDEIPKYRPGCFVGQPIKKGDVVDLKSILSGGCVDGSLLRCLCVNKDANNNNVCEFRQLGVEQCLKNNKYVLLFCTFVPAKWCEFNARCLCKLSLLSSELLQNDDFEMILVPKMREGCVDDVEAFHQFFSAFPGRLAIPFSEGKICDSMCASLGFQRYLKAILVGPDGSVLQDNVEPIIDYGAIGFPFTDDRFQTLANERAQLSLSSLLCRHPSFHLNKFKPASRSLDETESRSVEQLNEKVVGLYLFQEGDKLSLFHQIYQDRQDMDRAKGIEPQFEIVLVCMPLSGSVHPYVFQDEAFAFLSKSELDISCWWSFHADNSTCLRLRKLFEDDSFGNDAMIIVGPHNDFVDINAGEIVSKLGIVSYPFTREVIVQRYVKKAEEVTLESLLTTHKRIKTYAPITYVERGGQRLPLTDLRGKNVLLYVGSPPIFEYTYNKLIGWYPKLKKIDPDIELLFVYSKGGEFDPICIPKSWLVCCCEPELLNYFKYHHDAFYGGFSGSHIRGGLRSSVLAFGKDGHINMIQAIHACPGNTFPFDPASKDLRSEVIHQMVDDFEFMMDYE